MALELSYCVVTTGQRQVLSYCLDAIARESATVDFETETLVLDNASRDGSEETAREHPATADVVVLPRPRPAGENASVLLRHARGRFCLLLDEASELEPGATTALHAAMAADDGAGAACATLVHPGGEQEPSAFRFPAALAAVLPRRYEVQSGGAQVREVDWARSAALLVRSEAATAVSGFEPDEIEFGRRLRDAGWHVLYVPVARAVEHQGPARASDLAEARDRYLRRHGSAAAAGFARAMDRARALVPRR